MNLSWTDDEYSRMFLNYYQDIITVLSSYRNSLCIRGKTTLYIFKDVPDTVVCFNMSKF